MKAPFPWFGGKSRVAPLVWRAFGDVAVYAEPFAGSLAVLLGRPAHHDGTVETINDLDGYVCNAWRAIAADPEGVAYHADWPAIESDLHARHARLVEQRGELTRRLEGDPDYYDARIAGWWLWGMSQWIGGGFCAGQGPWARVVGEDGVTRLVRGEGDGGGVWRRRVHLGNAGRGVWRKRVHLSDAGRGDAGNGECGLLAWMIALSERLRRVRVCSGDWSRILTPAALAPAVQGPRGIFLDPPYSDEAQRHGDIYAEDCGRVAHDVRAWCLDAPRDYRIALCGYAGEGHEELERAGWSVEAWCANGGLSSARGRANEGNHQRERIWLSPACLRATAQRSLWVDP